MKTTTIDANAPASTTASPASTQQRRLPALDLSSSETSMPMSRSVDEAAPGAKGSASEPDDTSAKRQQQQFCRTQPQRERAHEQASTPRKSSASTAPEAAMTAIGCQ